MGKVGGEAVSEMAVWEVDVLEGEGEAVSVSVSLKKCSMPELKKWSLSKGRVVGMAGSGVKETGKHSSLDSVSQPTFSMNLSSESGSTRYRLRSAEDHSKLIQQQQDEWLDA